MNNYDHCIAEDEQNEERLLIVDSEKSGGYILVGANGAQCPDVSSLNKRAPSFLLDMQNPLDKINLSIDDISDGVFGLDGPSVFLQGFKVVGTNFVIVNCENVGRLINEIMSGISQLLDESEVVSNDIRALAAENIKRQYVMNRLVEFGRKCRGE